MSLKEIFGRGEICYGPMFSGKTATVIAKCSQFAQFQGEYELLTFRPELDTRRLSDEDRKIIEEAKQNNGESDNVLESRVGFRFGLREREAGAIRIKDAVDIKDEVERRGGAKYVVVIDECQLLDSSIIPVTEELWKQGHHVLASGLDLDYRGEPFQFADFEADMHDYIDMFPAEGQTRLTAICHSCTGTATHTQRLDETTGQPSPYFEKLIKIGDREYQARCRSCHECHGKDMMVTAGSYIHHRGSVTEQELSDFFGNSDVHRQVIKRLVNEKVIKYSNNGTRFYLPEYSSRARQLLGTPYKQGTFVRA